MNADELGRRVAHIFHEIVSAIQRLFPGMFDAHSATVGGDEIRTVPGSAVVSDQERQHAIDLFGESIHIDKERLEQGEVIVRKEIITETQMIAVPVTREELVIERKTRNGSSMEVLRGQQVVRIPISEERVLVRKETVLNERVTVRRRNIEEKKKVSALVRHEQLRIEKHGETKIDDKAA